MLKKDRITKKVSLMAKGLTNYLIANSRYLPMVLAILSIVLTSSYAHASTTGGSEFKPILTMIEDWIDGIPGILIAVAIILSGIFAAMSKGVMALFVSLIIAGAIFTVPAIASGIATAMGGAIF